MEESTSYLKKLRFDRNLHNSLIGKFLANPRLLFLLLTSVILIGVTSYMSLPRRLNPEVEIPLVIVSTVLPGANPSDVESLITEPLESVVRALPDVSLVSSSSQDSVSVMQIEFNSGVDPDDARVDVQSTIDQIELPEDAQSPRVQKIDFENQPVWTFLLTGNTDLPSLTRFSTSLKNELEDLPEIENAAASGLEEQEIQIIIKPEVLTTYGVSTQQISQTIRTALSSFPAGTVSTDNSTFTLAIDPLVTDIDDIRNLELSLSGIIIPLSSIASISEHAKPDTFPSYVASAKQVPSRTIVFNVYKTTTADIDEAVRAADETAEELVDSYGGVFEIQSIQNSGELINEQFNHLFRDFLLTIILVFVVLFVFLGARQAFVSFFVVPLTFLISFTVMNVMGISLNFLSMFSLLLSLGLLVDDTIVVISAMTAYYRTGKFTPLQTGLLVWKDFFVAILTTTLTTVWAFLPLLISGGIIGEFIKSIPIVVSATLIASFFVAMLMTLPLMILLLKPSIPFRVAILFRILLMGVLVSVFIFAAPKGMVLPLYIVVVLAFVFMLATVRTALMKGTVDYISRQKRKHGIVRTAPHYFENGLLNFRAIENLYKGLLRRILVSKTNRRRAVIMVVIFSLFSYLLLPLGFVKNEFFPSSDQKNVYLTLTLPLGTNDDVTEKEAVRLLSIMRMMPDVSYITADIGQTTGEFGGGASSGGNSALFSFTLPEREERARSSIEIAQSLRNEFRNPDTGVVTVSEVSGGPPAGADIQIKLFGNELSELDEYADQVVKYLEVQPGVSDVSKSIKEGTSKVVFVPDGTALAQRGVTLDAVGQFLRTFASGMPVDTAQLVEGVTDEQDITIRFSNETQQIEDLSSLVMSTPDRNVSLVELGKFELRPNPTLITREDGQRTISVTAGVGEGFTTPEVNAELEQFADSDLNLPDGYSWKTGGVNEENQESVNSILNAMLISFLLIIITMVIQFGSFRKAIIVMLVIPLSISGVFVIFSITGTPLSFPGLIGVLALFGIVVKNSILIVDKITVNERNGMDFTDGIIDATVSRLEPIALTSLATIMGLIPITLSDPLWRGLGGAIIAGLTFSGTLMLFFIPVVYYLWFNPSRKKRKRA